MSGAVGGTRTHDPCPSFFIRLRHYLPTDYTNRIGRWGITPTAFYRLQGQGHFPLGGVGATSADTSTSV